MAVPTRRECCSKRQQAVHGNATGCLPGYSSRHGDVPFWADHHNACCRRSAFVASSTLGGTFPPNSEIYLRLRRRTHLPAAGPGIWIPGGGRRRVRQRCGACDTCLDARGTTFAIVHRRHAMECPQRRIVARRVSASSCGLASPSLEGVEHLSAYRRIPKNAFCRSPVK